MTLKIPVLTQSWQRLIGVGAVVLLAVIWIASGVLIREPPAPTDVRDIEPVLVAVEQRRAQLVEQLLVLQGQVEPHQRVTVRAETAGQLAQWLVRLGADVSTDQEIARLRMDDREARRHQAIARLRDAESERAATQRLVERGAAPRLQLEAREAAVAAAEAELAAIETDIDNTRIRAPIDGVINRRLAERGDFLSIGGAIAEVIDNDPLLGVVHVPQHRIQRVERGQIARLRFLDGQRAEGEVSFVAAVAEPGTRTFRVEVEVPNPGHALPSGISAGFEIPTREVMAHRISPALVSLDDAGRVGVKTVDENDRVEFHPIEVIRTATGGIWVTGLPDETRIITVGQGFVREGETVRTREDGRTAATRGDAP